MNYLMQARRLMPVVAIVALAWQAGAASAQSASLWGPPDRRGPLDPYKQWTFERPAEPQPIEPHDVVTVVINEQSVVISEGQMDRKKKGYGSLTLSNWVLLKGLAAVPDPQTAGAPNINGAIDNKLQSDANLETRDSMKFRIACTVVDIRPNGNLIIEGRREIRNNEETWEYLLTGEIRARDVAPNNTVLSENVADMKLTKRETGNVRDGYRRGWLLRWLDWSAPF